MDRAAPPSPNPVNMSPFEALNLLVSSVFTVDLFNLLQF